MLDLFFMLVVFTVILALIFDFGNGINDAANAIATVVATRALPLWGAIILAAVGNFAGVFIFGVAVATTIAKGLVDPSIVTVYVILGGLVGSIFWVYFASYKGIPVSASHALLGGFIGAALAKGGHIIIKTYRNFQSLDLHSCCSNFRYDWGISAFCLDNVDI